MLLRKRQKVQEMSWCRLAYKLNRVLDGGALSIAIVAVAIHYEDTSPFFWLNDVDLHRL